jgi:hypothetical protein
VFVHNLAFAGKVQTLATRGALAHLRQDEFGKLGAGKGAAFLGHFASRIFLRSAFSFFSASTARFRCSLASFHALLVPRAHAL